VLLEVADSRMGVGLVAQRKLLNAGVEYEFETVGGDAGEGVDFGDPDLLEERLVAQPTVGFIE